MSENEWNQFGWEGISFTKPKGWDLGTVEGNEKRGYVRLDDHALSRMELRWQKESSTLSLEKVLTKYIRDLARKARRQKIDFSIINKKDYQTRTVKGKYFTWEADFRGINLVAQCRKTSRLLLACVFGKREENMDRKAEKIFSTLRDHTADGKLPWSVFDFGFTTPCELKLNNHKLLSGHLMFDFSRAEDSFIFERLSIANILLKDKSLTHWVMDFCRSQFKNVDMEAGYPREEGSEEGIYTVGREHGKFRFLKRRFFRSLFWHCQKTNHIFAVAELIRKREECCLDRLVSGVKCH